MTAIELMPSSPPALWRIWRKRRMSAWCTAMARDLVRTRQRHLCQRRRDPARGYMAGPTEGGGRLILPLTADGFPNRDVRHGAVFRIERRGPEFFARRISGVAIFPCEGGRDEASEQALAAAFDKGGAERVTRLYRATNCRKTNVGCARLAGVWLTADAPDILHPARPGEEAAALSDLCFRSKVVWGYDPEFMPLMPAVLQVVTRTHRSR